MPLLFSYGTLQQEDVQLSTFGRLLEGGPDKLLGYARSMFKIEDPGVVATSGKTHHPMATFCGDTVHRIAGTVFDITAAELASADSYEVAAYTRVLGDLESGRKAWVYVDARNAPTERNRMEGERAKLYFMCGKMAAGKSTFAKELARSRNAVLFVQDEFLDALYAGEIRTIPDFVKYSARLRDALSPHIKDLLSRGVSVVLDFPGNTKVQRQWFRGLIEGANVEHELHYVDARDDLCKRQLRQRSETLPVGAPWTTDAEFDAITAYFQAPAEDEGFNVLRHERA